MEVKEVKHKKKKKLGSYPYVSVVFSITLALFVIGLFGLLILHANSLTRMIRENVTMQIFLNRTISENDKIQIQKTLAGKEYVAVDEEQPQISFISKEEAAEAFIEDTGEDFTQFLGENPLRDAYIIKINQEYQDTEALAKVKLDIERMNGVFEVTYVENLVRSINQNLAKVSLVLLGFAVLLVIIVAVLINNTIRLALFSQRFLIRSMQLVGATSGFIQRPFLRRSFMHGILGGILASVLLLFVLQYLNQQIEDIEQLQNPTNIMILMGLLLIVGGFIGFLSTYRAISRYLKMSLDELY
ncbi:cell division transport system permease protein [Catalinimonas alkaloidigena]|uniref:cell division protein FtsX n=1 Tax=Catalinimonas alkaloidigena TaxID=1075417 RepID=UPI0024068E94|nr:permease-like cell division protein FtsX [Catalinimonas alkaloidigena]MDF9798446.1 cell division transport system permease protein [Catalinimonas alkaloidigena]